MRCVKVPGLDIQIPPGSAFKIDTPPMMPKMHLLAAVVAPRGYGKGVITTNLIEQLKVTGFSDRRTALRFESLMHLHRVTDVRERLDVAHAIVEKYAEEFGGVSVM